MALTAGVCIAGALLAERSLAVEGVQAVMAEWGATRLGASWSAGPATSRDVARRAGRGAALGFAAAAFVVAFAWATRAVTSVAPLVSVVGLGLALLDASLVALRDELLLHGTTLRLTQGRSPFVGMLACALASAAWSVGTSDGGVPLPQLVAEALAGASFAGLWITDRGAWAPFAAHAAWLLATRDALLTRAAATAWGGAGGDGSAGVLGGWAAVVALVPVCALAAVRARHFVETSAPSPLPG